MNELFNLFIDESGKADLSNKQYNNFLLSAIWINSFDLEVISGYFSFIKRKYQFPLDTPFHTYDLLENPKSMLLGKNRKLFLNSMAEFMETTPFKILIIHTNKSIFIKKHKINLSIFQKEDNRVIYRLSGMYLFQEFAKFLDKEQKFGAVHVDSRKYLDSELIKAFNDIKEPNYKGLQNKSADFTQRLCSIEFATKTALSGGLELVDFVSYVTFSYFQQTIIKLKLSQVWRVLRRKIKGENLITLPDSFVSNFLDRK